jgi:hypothetical protein
MIYKILFKTLLGVAVIGIFSLNACNNAKSEQNSNIKNENIDNASIVPVSKTNNNLPPVKAELEKAKKDKKTVFLVVTGNGTKTENINKIANDASKRVKQSIVIQLNRDDAANVDLVKEFRLTGAPLPLVIVIAQNGIPVGGLVENEATVENLVSLVPSAKMLELITALSDGKSIFVIAYKKSAKDIKQVNTNCLKACSDIKTAVTIELNIEDKTEANLIKQLNIDITKDITTFVINPAGQITGTYTGIPDAKKLVTDAKKVIKSSCCPGNNKSKCN